MKVHWKVFKMHSNIFMTTAASSRRQVFVNMDQKAFCYLANTPWTIINISSRNLVHQMAYVYLLQNLNTSRWSRSLGGIQIILMHWVRCWSQTSILTSLLLCKLILTTARCFRALSSQLPWKKLSSTGNKAKMLMIWILEHNAFTGTMSVALNAAMVMRTRTIAQMEVMMRLRYTTARVFWTMSVWKKHQVSLLYGGV